MLMVSKSSLGNDICHVLFVTGPFRESWSMMGGMENLFYYYKKDPQFVKDLARICTDYILEEIDKGAALGADVIAITSDLAYDQNTLMSPRQYEEFIFPYQRAVIEKFGLCYYGCCEPVHSRWEVLKKIPNLRSVSVSPWCDEDFMAEAMGRNYVYSRKPNPTLISTKKFDEDAIREDLRKTVRTAKNCNVEIVMKDVHTLAGEPWRMARWVQLAREVINE